MQRPATRRGLDAVPPPLPSTTTSSLYDELSASTLSISACSSTGAAATTATAQGQWTSDIEVVFSSAAEESAAYSQDAFEEDDEDLEAAAAQPAAADVWQELEQLHNTLQRGVAPRRSSSSSGSSDNVSSSCSHSSSRSSSPDTEDAGPVPRWQHQVQPCPAAGRDSIGVASVTAAAAASGDAEDASCTYVLGSAPVVQQGRGGTRLLAAPRQQHSSCSTTSVDTGSSSRLQLQPPQQHALTLSARETVGGQQQVDSAACRDASSSSGQRSICMRAALRRTRSVALQAGSMNNKAMQATLDHDGHMEQQQRPEEAPAACSPKAQQQPACTQAEAGSTGADSKQPCCGCSCRRDTPALPGWAVRTRPQLGLPGLGLGAWGALSASVQQLRAASLLDQLERLIQVAERQQQLQAPQQQVVAPLEAVQQPAACRWPDNQQQPPQQPLELRLPAEAVEAAETRQQHGSIGGSSSRAGGSSWQTLQLDVDPRSRGGKPAPAPTPTAPAPGTHSAAGATPQQQQQQQPSGGGWFSISVSEGVPAAGEDVPIDSSEAEATALPAHSTAAPAAVAASPGPDAAAGWFSITFPAEAPVQQQQQAPEVAQQQLSESDPAGLDPPAAVQLLSGGSGGHAECGVQPAADEPESPVLPCGHPREEQQEEQPVAPALQHRLSAAASAAAQQQQQQRSGLQAPGALLQKLRQVRGVLRAAAAALPEGFKTCSSSDLVNQSLLVQHFNASASRVRARIGGLSDEVRGLQRSLTTSSNQRCRAAVDRASEPAARTSMSDAAAVAAAQRGHDCYTSLEETLATIRRHRSAAAKPQRIISDDDEPSQAR